MQEEKGMTEEEMVVCIMDSMYMNLSKLWELVMDGEGRKELDMTEWLN